MSMQHTQHVSVPAPPGGETKKQKEDRLSSNTFVAGTPPSPFSPLILEPQSSQEQSAPDPTFISLSQPEKKATLIQDVTVLKFGDEKEPGEAEEPEIVAATSRSPSSSKRQRLDDKEVTQEEKKSKVPERSIFFDSTRKYFDKLQDEVNAGHKDITADLPVAMEYIALIRDFAYADHTSEWLSGPRADSGDEMAVQQRTQAAYKKEFEILLDDFKCLKARLAERLKIEAHQRDPLTFRQQVEDNFCKLALHMIEKQFEVPAVVVT